MGNPWKAQGHYSQLILFPTSFRSSSVAASLPRCRDDRKDLLKHQRMMLVILLPQNGMHCSWRACLGQGIESSTKLR